MTLTDLLLQLLEQADAPFPESEHFFVSEAEDWPEGHLDALTRLGFVRPGAPAASVPCPACFEEHWETPEAVDGLVERWLIACPSFGPQEIEPSSLQRYRIDYGALCRHLAAVLGNSAAPLELNPDRLWRLGTTGSATTICEVYLAGVQDGATAVHCCSLSAHRALC